MKKVDVNKRTLRLLSLMQISLIVSPTIIFVQRNKSPRNTPIQQYGFIGLIHLRCLQGF